MLRIAHIEEITELLLQVSGLIELQESRSDNFSLSVKAWLKSLEDSLAAGRLPQTAVVAALRGTIIAAEQGQVAGEIEFRGRSTRARSMSAAASNALDQATTVASSVLIENQPRIAEATRVAHQIAALALSREAILPREADSSSTEYLGKLRTALGGMDDLEAALVHLDGLVGPYDALVTLDRAIQPFVSHESRQ